MLRLVGLELREVDELRLHARHGEFDFHAGMAFEAEQGVAVARFCWYALSGPLAASRLAEGREACALSAEGIAAGRDDGAAPDAAPARKANGEARTSGSAAPHAVSR